MTAVLDLYVAEPVLGNDRRFVREAKISFGRPIIGQVGDNELAEPDQRRLDLTRWRFTRLELPFDLEDLANGRRYTEVTVRLTFDDPGVGSRGLSRPEAGAQGTAPDSELDTWGVGRNELTWKLSARDDRVGLRPRGRSVFAIIESPIDARRLAGSLDADVNFIHSIIGVDTKKKANPKNPLRFELDLADGEFTVCQPQ
jgi:hypothetical protein